MANKNTYKIYYRNVYKIVTVLFGNIIYIII